MEVCLCQKKKKNMCVAFVAKNLKVMAITQSLLKVKDIVVTSVMKLLYLKPGWRK